MSLRISDLFKFKFMKHYDWIIDACRSISICVWTFDFFSYGTAQLTVCILVNLSWSQVARHTYKWLALPPVDVYWSSPNWDASALRSQFACECFGKSEISSRTAFTTSYEYVVFASDWCVCTCVCVLALRLMSALTVRSLLQLRCSTVHSSDAKLSRWWADSNRKCSESIRNKIYNMYILFRDEVKSAQYYWTLQTFLLVIIRQQITYTITWWKIDVFFHISIYN